MRINTSETFLGRMLQQNKTLFVGNLTVSLRNVKQEKDLNDIAQAKESEIAEAVSNKDLIVERIQKMAEQSLSITLLTLEEMKTLAVLAMNESLSNGERIDLQKKMTELQFQLHENTSSLGLSLAGKSYEDVKHMKTLAVGINNSQDFDIATQLRLAEEQNILHRDADIYTWDRNGGVIVSFVLASKEEVASKKAEKINNWDQFNHDMYFEQAKSGDPSFQNVPMLFSTGSARRTVMMLDKRIEKVNKMQEELSEFKTLSNAEKLAPFYPKNNGIYSSLMGDTAYISYGYDGKQNDFILEHVQNKTKKMSQDTNFIIRGGKEYVKIGDELDGKLVRREIWENRFKKTFSPIGEIEAYNVDPFGLGHGLCISECDPYDFRVKSPDNELGKMIKKLDIFLKDEISKDFGLFIGTFFDSRYSKQLF